MSAAQTIPEEDRSTYLGSHDTAAVFGLHPYTKPINVYMNKLRLAGEQEQTELMEWGLRNQRAILGKFAETMRCELSPERFIRHNSLSWFGGTPDGLLIGKKAGVDAKNISWNRGEWGEPGSDQMPEYILMQCHHFMTLLNYDAWYVAVLFGGNRFAIYCVERDPEISDMIIEADGRFWKEHIEAETPPPDDGSESYREYIMRKFPKDNGDIRVATLEELKLIEEYREKKALLESCKEGVEKIKNQLCGRLENAAGIAGDFGKVTFKTVKGSELIDSKTLRAEMPDIAKKYTKTGNPSRQLRFYLKEEEE